MRRALGTGLAAIVLLGFAPLTRAHAGVPVLVLEGTGYGHGVGLSQWGAEYLARTGQSTEQILAMFYPGAALGQASGTVRVAVHKPATSTTTLTFPQGGEVRSALEGGQAPGFPVQVGPGGRVRITFDGSYRVDTMVAARSGASGNTRIMTRAFGVRTSLDHLRTESTVALRYRSRSRLKELGSPQ